MLEAQAQADGIETCGTTPLCIAAREGHTDVVCRLLAAGADCNWGAGMPVRQVARCGHAEALRLLLEAHADSDPVTGPGRQTLLLEVIERGHANVAQLLLQARAATDQVNDEFATPLHVACELGRLDVLHMLVEALADVNWVDNRGSTPFSSRSSRHCVLLAFAKREEMSWVRVALRRELERREGPKTRVDVRTGAFRTGHSRRPSAWAVRVRITTGGPLLHDGFRAPRL